MIPQGLYTAPPMEHCDSLISATWIVPVEPAGRVLEGHAVAVSNGRIVDLLRSAEARLKYQASATFDRPGHVLVPGLVNAHTHAAMTLLRGYADDLPLESWLNDRIWPAEKRWASAEMVRDGTNLAIAEMLTAGITCFSDQYFFPEIIAETASDAGMRANVGAPVLGFPTAWAGDASDYLGKAVDLLHDPYAGHPLISTCFAPHSTGVLSDEAFTELRVIADQLDVPVQIHLHETAAEVEAAVTSTGMRPLERLETLGLVNASLLAVHAVHVTEAEIELLADCNVAVAHCPRSNLKLASGIAPLAAFREAGMTVGLGTDGAASNNTLDMLSEANTAALLAKVRSDDAAVLDARDALELATMGSARALGLDTDIGSIEPGKWADLTCVDLGRLNSQPLYDPVSQLIYAVRADQVSDVWVAGKHLLDSGELTHMSSDDLATRADEWRERIAGKGPSE